MDEPRAAKAEITTGDARHRFTYLESDSQLTMQDVRRELRDLTALMRYSALASIMEDSEALERAFWDQRTNSGHRRVLPSTLVDRTRVVGNFRVDALSYRSPLEITIDMTPYVYVGGPAALWLTWRLLAGVPAKLREVASEIGGIRVDKAERQAAVNEALAREAEARVQRRMAQHFERLLDQGALDKELQQSIAKQGRSLLRGTVQSILRLDRITVDRGDEG